jgi:hypothetical protein
MSELDDLAAEVAAHRSELGLYARSVDMCLVCRQPWPCLVRRLMEREALTRGELDAAYEMATRMTQERDALRCQLAVMDHDLSGYRVDLEAAEEERDVLRAAGVALLARSPFFVTINHGADDVEICQLCGEQGRHADDCPWPGLERALAPTTGGAAGE